MERPIPQPRTITEADVAAYEHELATELPRFRVGYKDESDWQALIGRLLRPFNRHYMTRYTTVFGGVVWFPSRAWRQAVGPRAIYETLRHEAVHLRDMRRWWGLFHVSYVLLPLPAIFTMRAYWEWRGYTESLRVSLELDGRIEDSQLRFIEDRFVGPDYIYMLPFRGFVRRRLEQLRKRLYAENSGSAPT